MKRYKKLLAMTLAAAMLISTVGFAADIDFGKITENTNKEYSKYIDKALEDMSEKGMEANREKISVLLWQEPANIDDSIEADQIFVFVPEKGSDDVYGYAYYENGKSSGAAMNFGFGGSLGDVYSKEARDVLGEVKNPEEITNLIMSGRLNFLAYYIDADEDYIWVYKILEDSKYNSTKDEKYEIKLKTLYEEEEFIKIIKAEEKAYKEYIAEQEDKKEVTYKDKDGDVKEKKPKKDRDEAEDAKEKKSKKDIDDDEDEKCTCIDCPDPECALDPYDCDCDLETCTSEDCREDALEEKAEKEKKAKKEKREKKIKEIKDYGVFEGDETGDLKENDSITRAEFAVVVCRMLGIEPEKGKSGEDFDFDDVDDKHWAKEYIKLARKTGFISGRGGNKFDPDAKISYEEAMKILVSVMGYTPKAEQLGGYPYGYNKVAKELGIDKDLFFEGKKEAIRGDVMEMVNNSLDIPWMIEKVFGENAQYEIADGKNGEEKTLRIILEFKIEE